MIGMPLPSRGERGEMERGGEGCCDTPSGDVPGIVGGANCVGGNNNRFRFLGVATVECEGDSLYAFIDEGLECERVGGSASGSGSDSVSRSIAFRESSRNDIDLGADL